MEITIGIAALALINLTSISASYRSRVQLKFSGYGVATEVVIDGRPCGCPGSD